MRHTALILMLCFASSMASPAFGFYANPTVADVVTGTVLLNQKSPLNAKAILAALPADWKIKTDSADSGDKTIVFSAPGATVMIAYLDYAAPSADIRAAAQISWLWTNAAKEATAHQAQAVISIISSTGKMVEAYKLFTKVAACILEKSNASGVFMNNQYLLVPKGAYVSAAHNLLNTGTLPLYCWIYFGMQQEKDRAGGYTYGLQEFGIKEMEVSGSKHSLQDVHSKLYEAVLYALQSNIVITNGQTIPLSEGQSVVVRLSKAVYIDGETWKLEF